MQSMIGRSRGLVSVLVALTIVASATLAHAQRSGRDEEDIVLRSDTDYQAVASLVDGAEMQRTVEQFAALESRVTGYPGADRAAEMVEAEFRRLGLDDIVVEEFPAVVPIVKRDAEGRAASITVKDGPVFEILPLWPNLVRTPKTPSEGISGPLIYGGTGSLRSFNHQEVAESIVLLDFNCGADWFNAPLLGAKAVLFIEPEETLRGEAEQKFLSIPVDIPRYWVPKEAADYLLALLKSEDTVDITLRCDMEWERVVGKNVMARVRGTDPRLSKQQVVVQAYYDSISVTPTAAPGAENAVSMAALFQLIRAVMHDPPKRSVTFLATAGHFQALSGTKHFIRNRIRGGRSERRVRQMFNLADDARREIEEAADRVWEEETGVARVEKTEQEITDERMRAMGRIQRSLRNAEKRMSRLERTINRAWREDPNRGKLEEHKLTEEELAERERLIRRFEDKLPEINASIAAAQQAVQQARRLPRDASMQDKQAALALVRAAIGVRIPTDEEDVGRPVIPPPPTGEAVTDALDFSDEDISLWFSVDLSSQNNAFGVFYKGYYYNYSENIQWKFSDIGKKSREFGELIGQALGVDPTTRLADGINAIQGRSWQTYMAGKLALASEVATLGGIPGIGFATINDSRPWVDTPMDIPQHVRMENVLDQTRFLACLMCDLINIEQPRDFYDLQLDDNFVEVKGRLVEFDPEMTTFPDEPIEGKPEEGLRAGNTAIGVARTGTKTSMGVRSELFDIPTNLPEDEGYDKWDPAERRAYELWKEQAGRIHLIGLPNVRARGGIIPIEGYDLDGETGQVVMAPDMGVNGNEAYPIELRMDQEIKPVTCVMFHCKPMAIFDMVDQRFFELLSEIHVLDAVTDAEPYQYGYCLPLPPDQFTSAYEPVAVVYAPGGTRIKVTMGASVLGLRFTLVNPTEGDPEGRGYLIDDYPSMYATPYRVATNMWMLDSDRIERLRRHGIENNRVNQAHETAEVHLGEARRYLELRQYDKFMTAARAAWSYESRAYPDVRGTADDVIKGILFYLALLLPFAFFAERLLIASPDVRWQIVGFFGVFLLIFFLIALVHPAFAITFTPAIILLSFIILALTVLVISIIVQKFEEQMKEVRYEQTGIRTADVGRLSASGAAFNLGIANMRRRKVRTLLTCLTLILLTFTVLSCTSVVEGVRSNRIRLPKEAPYNGIQIRDKTWAPIGEPTQRVMDNEFGDRYAVAPRAWYFSSRVGEQSFVNVKRGMETYAATAMVGLTPQEEQITRPQDYLRSGGRWFRPEDNLVAIIPDGMAKTLNIAPDQVGTATISVFGTTLRVIGIVRSNRFKNHVVDLDGESITPVDYLLMQEQQQQQQQQQRGDRMSEDELREYIHLAPDAVLFTPYEFVINAGGTLRSVAIGIPDAEEARKNLDSLMQRVELNLYAGMDGQTFLCSAVGATTFRGTSDLVIPILIAAAIVLNTMLGSVYERVREIYIYSSLGLAPTHIAALFVAEASVYAILGAIAGYLVGQAMAKILLTFDLLTGLNLNYSSLSAVGSTAIIMITVLMSVIYPAKRASQIAMPGIERRWTLPEPEDDQIKMKLPFTVTGDQALGVNVFLREYLAAHADYSLGHFSTADIEMDTYVDELGEGYQISVMVWLAPYDLGVSERLLLQTVPTEDEEVYQIQAVIIRESGDESSWIRVTRNFINMLRKQYLLWRTFPAGLKGEYGQRGLKMLAGEYDEEQ